MAGTLSTLDAALKEDYQPAVREQLNNENTILSIIEKNTENIEGRRAVLSLHVTRTSGIGARAEGGALPSAGNQGYAEERVPLKSNYGRIQVSGQAIKAMKSDAGSFVRPVASELAGATRDLKRDVNRQAWGTSNGVIAALSSTGTGTTVLFSTTSTTAQRRQIEVGMVVDIGTVADPTAVVTAASVATVTSGTGGVVGGSFTITGGFSAASVTSSHFVFRSGAGGATGGVGQKEITGLQSIVTSATSLFNVDPATYGIWAATSNKNSGTLRSLSESLIAQTLDAVVIASQQAPNAALASEGVYRAYGNLLTSQKRFTNTVDLGGGYKGLEINTADASIGLAKDRDCPNYSIFFLNTKHLTEYQMSDWEFMEMDGAVLSRVANTDAYEATLFKYHELATDERNAHGVLGDITEQ